MKILTNNRTKNILDRKPRLRTWHVQSRGRGTETVVGQRRSWDRDGRGTETVVGRGRGTRDECGQFLMTGFGQRTLKKISKRTAHRPLWSASSADPYVGRAKFLRSGRRRSPDKGGPSPSHEPWLNPSHRSYGHTLTYSNKLTLVRRC